VILAHSVLILGGRWEGDEWANFGNYRHGGIGWLGYRMLTWSPRPASELALYCYYLAISWVHAPLITPFLTALWLLLIGCSLAAMRSADAVGGVQRFAVALTVLAMCLLGHKVFELFYWPMAAAAYMPALAGMIVVTFRILLGGPNLRRDRLVCCAALSLAAASAETGVFFVVGFTVVLLILEAPGWLRGGSGGVASAAWYLVPLAICIAVLASAFRFRVGNATTGVGTTDIYFHHLWPSLLATLHDLPRRFVSIRGPASDLHLGPGLLMKALLFAGFAATCRSSLMVALPWRRVVALACGLLATVVLTSLAAYYQYSMAGSEHHDTFQQCAIVLLLLLLARLVAPFWPGDARAAGIIGPFCLIAAIVAGMAPRLPGLLDDYALLPQIRAARSQTWDSGMDPAVKSIQFVEAPEGHVLRDIRWATGHFVLNPADKTANFWYVYGVLDFFGKQEIDFLPASDVTPAPATRAAGHGS